MNLKKSSWIVSSHRIEWQIYHVTALPSCCCGCLLGLCWDEPMFWPELLMNTKHGFGEFVWSGFLVSLSTLHLSTTASFWAAPRFYWSQFLIDESSIIIKYQVNRVLNYRININRILLIPNSIPVDEVTPSDEPCCTGRQVLIFLTRSLLDELPLTSL